jgi:hypothetical protein
MFQYLNAAAETFGSRSDLSEECRRALTNAECFIETLSLIEAIIYVKQTLWAIAESPLQNDVKHGIGYGSKGFTEPLGNISPTKKHVLTDFRNIVLTSWASPLTLESSEFCSRSVFVCFVRF